MTPETGFPKLLLLFFVFATVSASTAQAFDPSDIETGNGFERLCSLVEQIGHSDFHPSDKEVGTIGYCVGYTRGLESGVRVAMALTSMTAPDSLQAIAYCAPDEVTGGQSVRVVLKYIRDNPERAHEPTGLLAAQALHEAFPCSKSPGQTKKKK